MYKNHIMAFIAIYSLVIYALYYSQGIEVSAQRSANYTLYYTNATTNDAVCLDGTPGAFYFSEGTSDKWVFYFEGGGWCYSPNDCLGRSTTTLGSSSTYAASVPGPAMSGLMDWNASLNPDFYDANFVWMRYCDGASFSGTLSTYMPVNDHKVYFRGRLILDEIMSMVKSNVMGSGHAYADATDVLVTGCSAGGLASYIHADQVGTEYLPDNFQGQYGVAPMSGFFLDHDNVADQAVYEDEIKSIFTMSDAINGLDEGCVAALEDEPWKCMFAANTYAYITSPIFVMNSQYDSWQTACIMLGGYDDYEGTANGNCTAFPEYAKCQTSFDACTPDQITTLIDYGKSFWSDVMASSTAQKAGNGGFVYSCHLHCAEQSTQFTTITNPTTGVTLSTALGNWWKAGPTQKPVWYKPCALHSSSPVQCNPSCVDAAW